MTSAEQKYSSSQIGKAGRRLRKDETDADQRAKDLDVLAYWRTEHSSPLSEAFQELKTAATAVDSSAILAQREKRAKSIIDKLKRERSMNLTTMQDIGGCRAIVRVQKDVLKIARALRKKKHITLTNNYIKTPKIDGYRGVHLVGAYHTKIFNNLKIEIQIRTKIQHAWATAGEITELFSATPIKNLYGDDKWKQFYELVGDCFAIIDERYITRDFDVDNLDINDVTRLLRDKHAAELQEKTKKIKQMSKELQVHKRFEVFRASLNFSNSSSRIIRKYCVIHAQKLSTDAPRVTIHMNDDIHKIRQINFEIERSIVSDSDELVVMLTVNSMNQLEKAYPNYFADSEYFLKLLKTLEKI